MPKDSQSEGSQAGKGASLNVIALVKDSERYVFLYDDESTAAMLQTLRRYAADKTLSFTWFDAALLSQKVRKLYQENEADAG